MGRERNAQERGEEAGRQGSFRKLFFFVKEVEDERPWDGGRKVEDDDAPAAAVSDDETQVATIHFLLSFSLLISIEEVGCCKQGDKRADRRRRRNT